MKYVLISGGLGYLSQNLIGLISNKQYRFVLVDNKKFRKTNPSNTISYIQADITKGESLSKLISSVLQKDRIEIDGIINTPAWSDFQAFKETDFESIQKTINTKLIGYANIIKATLPYLKNNSSIINIGSVQAHTTRGNAVMYAASNGGVISMSKALAVEFRDSKIRVNVISAGGFDSTIFKNTHSDWKQRIKNGQCLSTTNISHVIDFLLSDNSIGINGTEIVVDGGISAMRAKSSDY